MRLTSVSLFSGIGGVDLAFESVGVETIAVCDIDTFCQNMLSTHFSESVLHKDIKDLNGVLYEGVDILITTPPCQPVSVAGKRKGDEDGRWLWEDAYLKYLETKEGFDPSFNEWVEELPEDIKEARCELANGEMDVCVTFIK